MRGEREFPIVRRGYDMARVDAYLGVLLDELDRLAAANRLAHRRLAGESADAQLAPAPQPIEVAGAEHERLLAALETVRAEHRRLMDEVATAGDDHRRLIEAELQAANAELDSTRAERDRLTAEAQAAATELDTTHAEHDRLITEADRAQAALDHARTEHRRLTADIDRARTALDHARTEHQRLTTDIDRARTDVANGAARGELDRLQDEIGAARTELDRLVRARVEVHRELAVLGDALRRWLGATSRAGGEHFLPPPSRALAAKRGPDVSPPRR